MAESVLWIGILVVSIVVLVKSSDVFTETAQEMGIFFGIPQFIIGVTVVALGTSLPELVSSIIAVVKGSSEIVPGNVVGSNVANVFLVLGFSAVVAGNIKVTFNLFRTDVPLFVSAAAFLVLSYWDKQFTLFEAIIALGILGVYLAYAVKSGKVQEEAISEEALEEVQEASNKKLMLKFILLLPLSGVFIYLGAEYTVTSVIHLSEIFNIGSELIAVTVIALGTSLPELAVGIQAARRGNPEIVIGNVLGSNIFNSLAVMGIPALIGTINVPSSLITGGLPFMVVATLLFFFFLQEKELNIWDGLVLLLFYVFFIGRMIFVPAIG